MGDDFKFFDLDEPMPPFTALDKFCMTVCAICFGGAVVMLLAGWL